MNPNVTLQDARDISFTAIETCLTCINQFLRHHPDFRKLTKVKHISEELKHLYLGQNVFLPEYLHVKKSIVKIQGIKQYLKYFNAANQNIAEALICSRLFKHDTCK